MSNPSLRELVRDLVLSLFPWLLLSGLHTYRVARVNADGTVDLEPPAGVLGPPPLPRIGQWLAAGYEATPTIGTEVLIVYRDNREKSPAIVAFTPLRIGKPAAVRLDVAGAGKVTVGDPNGSPMPVARVGDTIEINVTFGPGSGAATLTNGGPLTLTGTITSGSPKLESE